MNKIEAKVILDKAKILYTEVLRRFLVENDFVEDFL
jgi:hypothetical protein